MSAKVSSATMKHGQDVDRIEVLMSDGRTECLFHGLIEHCSKTFSNNDLRKIFQQIKTQIDQMNPDDVPPILREMMQELTQVMVNRKIYSKCHSSQFCPNRNIFDFDNFRRDLLAC